MLFHSIALNTNVNVIYATHPYSVREEQTELLFPRVIYIRAVNGL